MRRHATRAKIDKILRVATITRGRWVTEKKNQYLPWIMQGEANISKVGRKVFLGNFSSQRRIQTYVSPQWRNACEKLKMCYIKQPWQMKWQKRQKVPNQQKNAFLPWMWRKYLKCGKKWLIWSEIIWTVVSAREASSAHGGHPGWFWNPGSSVWVGQRARYTNALRIK